MSCPALPWYTMDQACIRERCSHLLFVLLCSLGPAFRGGLIHTVESVAFGLILKSIFPGSSMEFREPLEPLLVNGVRYQVQKVRLHDQEAAKLHQKSWARIQSLLGVNKYEMFIRALVRLWILHLSTPLLFIYIAYAAWPLVDSVQLALLIGVCIREVTFVALVLTLTYQRPGFLFFDILSTKRIGELGTVVTFILSPDLLLLSPDFLRARPFVIRHVLWPLFYTLDLCAIAALLYAWTSGQSFGALDLLYTITGASAIWASCAAVFGDSEMLRAIRATASWIIHELSYALTFLSLVFLSFVCLVMLLDFEGYQNGKPPVGLVLGQAVLLGWLFSTLGRMAIYLRLRGLRGLFKTNSFDSNVEAWSRMMLMKYKMSDPVNSWGRVAIHLRLRGLRTLVLPITSPRNNC